MSGVVSVADKFSNSVASAEGKVVAATGVRFACAGDGVLHSRGLEGLSGVVAVVCVAVVVHVVGSRRHWQSASMRCHGIRESYHVGGVASVVVAGSTFVIRKMTTRRKPVSRGGRLHITSAIVGMPKKKLHIKVRLISTNMRVVKAIIQGSV